MDNCFSLFIFLNAILLISTTKSSSSPTISNIGDVISDSFFRQDLPAPRETTAETVSSAAALTAAAAPVLAPKYPIFKSFVSHFSQHLLVLIKRSDKN